MRKKGVTPVSSGPKNVGSSHVQSNHVRNPIISKVQKLKDTKDYSFIMSDNAEGPGQPKNPMQQSHSGIILENMLIMTILVTWRPTIALYCKRKRRVQELQKKRTKESYA
ncbi:hypothetical protein Dimus_021453 [Dionaea muscipula]